MSQLNVDNIRNRTGSDGGPNFPSGISVAVGQTAYIHGNLQVDGTETIINTETLNVADKTVGIGSTSNASNTTADGAGIEIFASSSQVGNNKTLTWNSTENSWQFAPNDVGLKVGTGVTIYGGTGIVSATSFKGDGSLLTGIDATSLKDGGGTVRVQANTDGAVVTGILTATSYKGDGSQLSGIEAAPTIQATASGAIAANKTVVVNSDGTVSEISISSISTGSDTNSNSGNKTLNNNGAWDETGSYFVYAFRDYTSGYSEWPGVKVGTLSGTTITFGSTTYLNGTNNCNDFHGCVNVGGNKFAFVFRKHDNNTAFMIGEYDTGSSSWSFGTTTNYGGSYFSNVNRLVFDKTNGIVAFSAIQSGNGRLVCFQFDSSKNITNLVTDNNWTTSGNPTYNSVAYDSTNNVFFVAYQNSGLKMRITYAGTSTTKSFGTELSVHSSTGMDYVSSDYDPDIDRFVVTYRNSDAGNDPIYFRTVRITSLSTPAIPIENTVSADGVNVINTSTVYNPIDKATYIMWSNDSAGGIFLRRLVCTTSSITLSSTITLKASAVGNDANLTVNPNSGNIISLFSRDSANTGNYIVHLPALTNLRSGNFIGFSKAAYSNSATATVNVVGNTTTQSGLTAGQRYYVQTNGTLSTVAGDPSVIAGRSISSTKLLIQPA